MMTKTWIAAALLPALLLGSAGALGQATDEHEVHHPDEPELVEGAAAAQPDQPGAGMMGGGMMGQGTMGMMGPGMMGEAPEGGPGGGMMGVMGPGMMGHGMMHHPGVVVVPPAIVVVPPAGMMGHGMMGPSGMGMMGQGMMTPGMPGPEDEEADPMQPDPMQPGMMQPGMMQPGMMQPGMMGRGMMQGRGMGPAMLYGVPPAELSVERVQAMLEGGLARHGNPRLKLGEVAEQDEGTIVAEILTVDDSLVQRLAVDRATGAMRQLP